MPTIQKRGNSYRITVSNGYDINERQIRVQKTWTPSPGMTPTQIKKELNRQAVMFEEQVKCGRYVDNNIKFADFSERWMNEHARSHLSPTTFKRYSDCLKRINKAIGHIKLAQLQPLHLNSFYLNLQEIGVREDEKYKLGVNLKDMMKSQKITQKQLASLANISESTLRNILGNKNTNRTCAEKLSKALNMSVKDLFKLANEEKPLDNATIRYYHCVISSILSTAVDWQIILFNPAERVKPPKVKKKETEYLDDVQTAELLKCLEDERPVYRILFTLMLYTGLRRGEACGLTWNDIDFKKGTLNVNKANLYLPEKGIFTGETKTETSNRVIKMSSFVVDSLRELKKEQFKNREKCGDRWINSNLVFTSDNGKPLHPDAVSKRFREFIKGTDLPYIKLHALRHTNATLLIANGTDIKTVSKRLGHASIATTGNIYAHAIKSADERAADALDNLFKKQA